MLHCGYCGRGVVADARKFRSRSAVEDGGYCCWVRRSSHSSYCRKCGVIAGDGGGAGVGCKCKT